MAKKQEPRTDQKAPKGKAKPTDKQTGKANSSGELSDEQLGKVSGGFKEVDPRRPSGRGV